MPLAVCKKINGHLKPTAWEVTHLDRTNVKVVREMENVLIRLSANEKICQYIDIVVAYIPDGYGLILIQDWSTRLKGYFASDRSHLWLPHKGVPNRIKILWEPYMKHNVTQLEGKNEPVNCILGNYLIELEPGNFASEEASNISDTQPNLLRFSRADEIDCKIVVSVSDIVFSRPVDVVFDNG